MAKRSDNLESTLLILELLRHIPKKRFISAKELYEELNQSGFKRDLRTIQRNLNTLSQHFDIECDMRTKPYGYRWKEKSVGLSLPMLTEAQSLVLMLAKQQLKNLLPSNVMASMKPFFEQAERKLIYDQKDNAENEWLDKVCSVPTSQPLLPAEINKSIFTEISQALFYNKYLAIEYINQTGKSIKGRIMPLALAQQGASLYLVARFDGHDNERHLALHRFKSAEMSTMSFVRPKEFDLKKYQADARFGFGAGKKIKLRFYISHWAGFHLTETKLSKDQKILEETDEYYRFEATVIESEMLDWWLLKFGDEVWEIDKIYLD